MLDATEESPVRTRVLNGVAVPSTDLEEAYDHYPDHEGTVISAFRRRVRRGDRAVVVGGGWGTTAVVAARMTHFEGDVTVFEPNSEMVETIRRTIDANRVADLVTVEHASIGPVSDSSERIFGDADGERRPPTALPDCDVLDVDCEGAEVAILDDLPCRPRLLTVEAHPHLGGSREAVESRLADMGYEVVEKAPVAPDTDITNYVAVREPSEAAGAV